MFSVQRLLRCRMCSLKNAGINRYACLYSLKNCTSFTTCSFFFDLPHTKFHIPSFNSFLVIVTKPHVKEHFHTSAMFLLHIPVPDISPCPKLNDTTLAPTSQLRTSIILLGIRNNDVTGTSSDTTSIPNSNGISQRGY